MCGVRKCLIFLFILGFLAVPGCGEVTFFFAFNTGIIDDARTSGVVLIIGTPREDLPDSVRLFSGIIPPGMHLEDDATVRGIPEASGTFFFEIEVTEIDGQVGVLPFEVEIE